MRRLSPSTARAYAAWARRLIEFHGVSAPSDVTPEQVAAFLSHLAVERRCSASTQTQALSAMVFLFRDVLEEPLGWLSGIQRARRPRRVPAVLSADEVRAILAELGPPYRLMASLMYGAGLRLSECCALRVRDIDAARGEIIVRDGKGLKDRVTLLPERARVGLDLQLRNVRQAHGAAVAVGGGKVELPVGHGGWAPYTADWPWQWLFPGAETAHRSGSRLLVRRHIHPSGVQRAVRAAIRAAGITKQVSCHTFRHSFATHLIESGHNIRTVQKLLGHHDVQTTLLYTRTSHPSARSPLDIPGVTPRAPDPDSPQPNPQANPQGKHGRRRIPS